METGETDDWCQIEQQCPQCGNHEMKFYTLQLRSADEGATVFYRCDKCGHRYGPHKVDRVDGKIADGPPDSTQTTSTNTVPSSVSSFFQFIDHFIEYSLFLIPDFSRPLNPRIKAMQKYKPPTPKRY